MIRIVPRVAGDDFATQPQPIGSFAFLHSHLSWHVSADGPVTILFIASTRATASGEATILIRSEAYVSNLEAIVRWLARNGDRPLRCLI